MLKRTKLGLFHAFVVQYDGLRLSASFYDVGHRGEAVRMANAMFVLLGPRARNHKSVIDQIQHTQDQWIYSTAAADKVHGSALIAVQAVPYTRHETDEGGWVIGAEPFGIETIRSARQISVTEWWNEGVLRGVGDDGYLTRLQVVRSIRDQDGGAHLDVHINNPTYEAIHLRGVGFNYTPSATSTETLAVEGAIEATIRQMTTEVIESLKSLMITAQMELREASKRGPLSTQYFELADKKNDSG